MVVESNGDMALGPESGEMWPSDLDSVMGSPSPLSLEEKGRLGEADRGEDLDIKGDSLVEDRLLEQPLHVKHNCERLSPQSLLEVAEADPTELEMIFIEPLDGSQAELRSRVIKEVRKPGRSKSYPV